MRLRLPCERGSADQQGDSCENDKPALHLRFVNYASPSASQARPLSSVMRKVSVSENRTARIELSSGNLRHNIEFMITKRQVVKYAAVIACIAGTAVTASAAGSKDRHATTVVQARPVERVIYVEVTGSRIPQRVVLMGNNVNSASPLFVMQSHGLLRSGSATLGGMLAMDPSIFIRPRPM